MKTFLSDLVATATVFLNSISGEEDTARCLENSEKYRNLVASINNIHIMSEYHLIKITDVASTWTFDKPMRKVSI